MFVDESYDFEGLGEGEYGPPTQAQARAMGLIAPKSPSLPFSTKDIIVAAGVGIAGALLLRGLIESRRQIGWSGR